MIKIIQKDEISSTNTWSKENIYELEDKTIIIANRQTQGRGRFVRKWISDNPKNLYLSFVLKPKGDKKFLSELPLANLTQYLAIVLAGVLEKYGVKPQLKWPNDILINGKKISGILAELVIKKGEIVGIVLGLGLNLQMSEEELKQIDKPATSLNLETDISFSKQQILDEIIEKFFESYDKFLEKGFPLIRSKYLDYFYLLNEKVKINFEINFVEGKIKDINENGFLILENNHGELQEISIGDIL